MGTQESNEVNKLVDDILADYKKGRAVDKMMAYNMPDQEAVRTITKKLIRMLLPGFYRDKFYKSYSTPVPVLYRESGRCIG